MTNREIAVSLRSAADLLELQQANLFRVQAYRKAANAIEQLTEPVSAIAERTGHEGLVALPAIGHGIAQAIEELLRTGGWALLNRLRGRHDPEKLFRTVPGIGPKLAELIHDQLHIDTLEALEIAAQDGRLEALPGIGPRRATAVRTALDSMLGRGRRQPGPRAPGPSVELLLAVDRQYREQAASGRLSKIAPRRFNPSGKAWLPVLHTERDGWHFTALYSNSARAHQLGRTHDWVVIYHYDARHLEGQHTVVTERRGPLKGQRVVRGREAESRLDLEHRSRDSGKPRS